MADLLQLDDAVVALLQRGNPFGKFGWGVGSDHPPWMVGALDVLAVAVPPHAAR